MRKRAVSLFGTGCLHILLSPLVSRAIVIDDFQQGPLVWTLSGNFSTSAQALLMDGLDTAHTVGGKRLVNGATTDAARLQILTDAGRFQFDAAVGFGYFGLTYGSPSAPLDVDLLADGSDAFLIALPEVTPGLWRGIYSLSLSTPTTSKSVGFEIELFALHGSGKVRIPFSRFSGLDLRHVSSITIDAARVEPTFRISIGAISTVPEQDTSLLATLIVGVLVLSRPRELCMLTNLCRA